MVHLIGEHASNLFLYRQSWMKKRKWFQSQSCWKHTSVRVWACVCVCVCARVTFAWIYSIRSTYSIVQRLHNTLNTCHIKIMEKTYLDKDKWMVHWCHWAIYVHHHIELGTYLVQIQPLGWSNVPCVRVEMAPRQNTMQEFFAKHLQVCRLDTVHWHQCHRFPVPIPQSSRELTYPPKMAFWRWCSYSQGGIC